MVHEYELSVLPRSEIARHASLLPKRPATIRYQLPIKKSTTSVVHISKVQCSTFKGRWKLMECLRVSGKKYWTGSNRKTGLI